MIATGSMVLMDREGTLCPIEKLRVGDEVLNPFAGFRDRIAAITPYRYICRTGFEDRGAERALLIPAGALSPVAPARDLVVSADQELMIARREPGMAHAALVTVRAGALHSLGIPTEALPYPEIEYLSLTLTRSNRMVVNHVLCTARQADQPTPLYQTAGDHTWH